MFRTIFILLFLSSVSLHGNEQEVDLKDFAQEYYDKLIATQAPNATENDLENYLQYRGHPDDRGCAQNLRVRIGFTHREIVN